MIRPNYGQKDAQHFELRAGGGCASVFGFPFFCAGIFVLLAALDVIPFSNRNEITFLARGLMFLMSIPFIGIGGTLLFGRRLTRIDLSQGRIFNEYRVLVPVKVSSYLIGDYKGIILRHESGGSDSEGVYSVSLLPSANLSPLTLHTAVTYPDARDFAAALSAFLKFPLEDVTSGHKSVVEAADAAKSLKERLAGEGETEKIARPVSMRAEVTEESGLLRIRIPPEGVKISSLLPFTIPLLLLTFFISKIPKILAFFESSRTPSMIQYIILGFAAFFFSLPVIQLISTVIGFFRDDAVVEVGSGTLTFAQRKSNALQTVRIPLREIYDIDYSGKGGWDESFRDSLRQQAGGDPEKERQLFLKQQELANAKWVLALQKLVPSRGVILKAQSGIFTIGAGLGDDELQYLCYLIKDKLARS